MENDLKTILAFLARCGAEVEPRSAAAEPKNEEATVLQRFATGECSKDERSQACRLLVLHPEWVPWVSGLVKVKRHDPLPLGSSRDEASHCRS